MAREVSVSAGGYMEQDSAPPPPPPVLSLPINVYGKDTVFELRSGDDPTTSLALFRDAYGLGDEHSHLLWDTVRKSTLLQGQTPIVRRFIVDCRGGRLMNCLMKAVCFIDKGIKYDIAFIAEASAYKAVCSARKTVKSMGYKDLTLSFFPSEKYGDAAKIPLDSILSLARKSETPSVITYIPKNAPSTCLSSYSPVTQQGVQVDVFLQYSRMQFAAYGNTSKPLLVNVGDNGVVVTGSEEGERRSLAMYGPRDEEETWELGITGGGRRSITVMLVEPDSEAGTSYAVFSDIIKTLMSSLSRIGVTASLLRCPVFSQGECSRDNLHKRAEGDHRIIVLAPHLLSRITFQHNDVPVVLADPTILPEGTILYNFEHVKRGKEGEGLLGDQILKLYSNDRFEVWDYSQSNVLTLSSEYKIDAKLVPIKHEKSTLGTVRMFEEKEEEEIDVLFYGTVTPYRREIIDELRAAGVEVTVVTDSTWGLYFSALDDVISRSSIILVLNAFGGEGEWKITRLSKLLELEKFIVCEKNGVEEEEIYEGEEPGIVFAEKESIVEVLKEWWEKGPEKRRKVGKKGKEAYEAQGGMGEALRVGLGMG